MNYVIKSSAKQMSQRKIDGYLKLCEVVNYGRKYPVKFCERFYGIEFLDSQKYAFMRTWTTQFNVWCQSRASGKALSLDTKIATPTGFTTMGELKIGDYVFSEKGYKTQVKYISPIFYGHDCYEVTFSDGEKIISDAEHLWHVMTRSSIKAIKKPPLSTTKRKCTTYDNMDSEGFLNIKTEDMIKNYVHIRKDNGDNEFYYRVAKPEPLQYEKKALPINPYLLGLWIGDGYSESARISCGKNDLEATSKNINDVGYETTLNIYTNSTPAIRIGTQQKGKNNPFKDALRSLNLLNNKHIPDIYLMSDVEDRFELLRGLMDSDGTCSKVGECSFSQKKKNIIDSFSQLLSSLGIKHGISKKISTCKGKKFDSFVVHFFTSKENSCFKLERKHNLLKDSLDKRFLYKAIVSVKKVDSVPTKCISVDNPTNLYLCGERNTITHNTTLLAPFAMAKTNLVPNFQAYVMSGVGSQAQEMFTKLEKIAKREIASFTGLTDVFQAECVKSASNKDGFTHNPASFHYSLYNGSALNSLNGAFDSNRSKRSNLNIYDESGFAPTELFETSMPFITQNSDFKLGGDIDVSLEPMQFRNQAIFASSASSMDTYFYKNYKEYAKKMILGDKNYFVVDINADVVMNATYNGKIYPVPLLTKEVIDDAMRKNKDKALREYFNKFSSEGGDGQIIKRASIIRNSEIYKPVLFNENKSKFAIAYDPARSYDNSVCGVGEFFLDEHVGWKMRIVNVVSFADIAKKKKTPLRTPEQVKLVKQMILDYNGKQCADYENIESLMIDSGAGGGGVQIADGFMENWKDSSGRTHKGLIDKEESSDYVTKFPLAIDKLKLMGPSKYKKLMYDALIEMINLDLIVFPDSYDGKGYIQLNSLKKDEHGEEQINTKIINLSFEEEMALVQADLMKEEIVNIHRFTSGTNYRYDLAPHKSNIMNDDRAYVLAMLGWHLQQIRRSHITKPKTTPTNLTDAMKFKQPIIHRA